MRIKKIEVNGFKSFADRQVVVVDERVTGVIGPNGCGKSNIVDAIRWCLGEQRAKHLRGSGMGDVIFAGSSTRGPAGMAEVVITFENEGDIAPPWAQYAEVSIARRLFKDGTSEYLINKVPCRLRDINDMLMGTGIGKGGYSIIEQGRVGQIVTSKPESRRQIIDEAAGITKFKLQRAAAERKIEQTRQNLLRVTDVIGELEGRLGALRRQAQKAERYRRYREELTDLELWMASHRYLELEATSRVLRERLADLDEQVGALRTETSARETRLEAQRIALSGLEERFSTAQERVFSLENRISLIEQDRRFQIQEREGLERSIAQSEAEVGVVSQSLASFEGELGNVVSQQAGLGDGAGDEGEVAAVERLEGEYDAARADHRESEAELDRLRRELASCVTEVAGVEARLGGRTEAIQESEGRLTKVVEEFEALEAEFAEEQTREAAAAESLIGVEKDVEVAKQRRVRLDAERGQLRDDLRKVEVEVETQRKELLRARSRLQSLEEIQQRYRGCASGVQVVMEHRERLASPRLDTSGNVVAEGGGEAAPAVYGIMADYVTAPAHLEAAVSAVLGDRLQGVVVDGPRVGVGGVELLKELQEGRTAFLPTACRDRSGKKIDPLRGRAQGWSTPARGEAAKSAPGIEVVDLSDTQPPAHPEGRGAAAQNPEGPSAPVGGRLGRLAELVEVDARARDLADVLLGDTEVVETLTRALELWHAGEVAHPLVTLDGDRIEPSGVVVGGSADALDSALLQQKREIKELTDVVAELESVFEQVKARRQGAEERLRDLEEARERGEAELLDVEKQRLAARQEVEGCARALERLGQRLEQVRSGRSRLEAELEQRGREKDELGAKLDTLKVRIPQLEAAEVDAKAKVESLEIEREASSQRLGEARVALARWQQERDALADTRSRLEKQVASERDRVRRLEKIIGESRQRVTDITDALEKMVAEHGALLDEHKQVTTEKHDAHEAYEAAKLGVDELEVSIRNLRQQLDAERESLSEVELGLRELDLERGHLEEDVRERLDREVREILIDFHGRALAGTEEKKRATELKRIISRMGEVNLTAITEYEEVSQRFEYLSGQREDLEQAISQLAEAIEKINQTTKERFKETFEAVNETFQQIFPRLFSGGRAELTMTDPNDLLGTGVEIFAQPPGKKIVSLELLSGGEKALTAVSLIFAIFLNKPSPFCLLDEVDAPLDEANVGRFCDLVQTLSDRTQFLIITHNKRTMETADQLYGVTMQQKGVSKLVSVNLRRKVEEHHVN